MSDIAQQLTELDEDENQELLRKPARFRRMVLSLEMRGFRLTEISKVLAVSYPTVVAATKTKQYRRMFASALDECDDEFTKLKPQAIRAVADGLADSDSAIALKAADMWFRGAGYRGFGKGGEAGPRESAEDIARALFEAGGGKVTIEVERAQPALRLVGGSDGPAEH